MHVELDAVKTDLSGALTHHLQRRLRFALGHLAGEVNRVSATVNGTPGRNVQCRLVADLNPFGHYAVQASAPDLISSLDQAIGKLRRLLEREKEKAQGGRVSIPLAA